MAEEKKVLTALDIRKQIEDFKLILKDKTNEELLELEKDYIKQLDDNDELVNNKVIKLHKAGYKAAASAVLYFLNKQSVQWQYAGTIMTQYNFWSKPQTEINYLMLDYILNLLGGLQYTGVEECKRVIDIDNYITPIKAEYGEVRTNTYILAEKHNAIMEALKLVEPLGFDESSQEA